MAVFPGQSASTHQRYGLAGADARKALDEAFARHFGANPSEKQRWRALVTEYGDWYRRQAVPASAPARHGGETVPLTKAMLREALTRGPVPFHGAQPPVIRERRIPVDDDENERTEELPPSPPGAPWRGHRP